MESKEIIRVTIEFLAFIPLIMGFGALFIDAIEMFFEKERPFH